MLSTEKDLECIRVMERVKYAFFLLINNQGHEVSHTLLHNLSKIQMHVIFTSVTTVVSSGVGGRGELSLAEVQCHLDKEGASDLVIDLIMNATSDRIFQESILLAIAMLEGGNPVIQVSGGSVG